MNPLWQSMAIWAITPDGAAVAENIARKMPGAVIFTGRAVASPPKGAAPFTSLADAVSRQFSTFEAHVFVMAAGIAVRMIAPHIGSKQTDPAVVVVDDAARFAISLLSGHLGGANTLTGLVAHFSGAAPVVTTATDNAGVPAVDMIAKQHGLFIENPEAVKTITMAFLTGRRVWRHDPWKITDAGLKHYTEVMPDGAGDASFSDAPGIVVDYTLKDRPKNVLVARPRILGVGVGCNSNTPADELICAVQAIFDQYGISTHSIRHFATIDKKTREAGMVEMAAYFNRPLAGFSKQALGSATSVPTPSNMVLKHMGVTSVCEAAAIVSMDTTHLLIPKQKTKNTTLAVAVKPYT